MHMSSTQPAPRADTPLSAEGLFAALADSTRLRAVVLLHHTGERCVCELCDSLGVSQPKMSRHLAHLRDAGVVAARREGRWMHYGLADSLPVWASATIACSAQNLAAVLPFQDDIARWERQQTGIRRSCQT